MEEAGMKAFVLAALFAIGVTLALAPSVSAAPIGNSGISKAAESTSSVHEAYCRWRRVCHWSHGRRWCHTRRWCY